MTEAGTLLFFSGKMGAGKTTRSVALASAMDAIRISEDEWLQTVYPQEINTFDDYRIYSARLRPLVAEHVGHILCTGVSVVMDFPANTVKQRRWFKAIIDQSQSRHRLIYLNASDELCLQRLALRRQSHPERASFDTEKVFREVTGYFEPPSVDEGFNLEVIEQ